MSDIPGLQSKKDGSSLKSLADQGDPKAAMAFAELVFNGQYKGDLERSKTKKEAKRIARQEAIDLMIQYAESGDLDVMAMWAGLCFEGIREPGQFGSIIRTPFYKEAEDWYQALASHPDSDDAIRHRSELRLGQVRFVRKAPSDEVKAPLHKVIRDDPDSTPLAHWVLSNQAMKDRDYSTAVSHALKCAEAYPYSLLILEKCYREGLGVETSEEQARQYYSQWESRTSRKKK